MTRTENQVLNLTYEKGENQVYPAHPMVGSWLFTEETEDEATLCHQIAKVAEKSGMSANEMQHLFPAILRMLRNKSEWAMWEQA